MGNKNDIKKKAVKKKSNSSSTSKPKVTNKTVNKDIKSEFMREFVDDEPEIRIAEPDFNVELEEELAKSVQEQIEEEAVVAENEIEEKEVEKNDIDEDEYDEEESDEEEAEEIIVKNLSVAKDDVEIEEIVVRKAASKKHKVSRKRLDPKKANKASWKRFWIGLTVYAAILVVLFIVFQIYTHGSLVKYENSQSIYAMQKYYDDFCEKIAMGSLPEGMTTPSGVTTSEYINSLAGKKISFSKAKDNYSSEKPIYSIYADGEEIARVSYEGYNEEVIFAILTVLDWKVVDARAVMPGTKEDESAVNPTTPGNPTEPTSPSETETTEEATTVPTTEYTIRVPSAFTVYVDNRALTYDDVAELTDEMEEMLYVNPYQLVCKMTYYKVNVPDGTEIKITDQFDNIITPAVNGTTISADMTVIKDNIPQAYIDTALQIAQTWSLFMTRDLSGDHYGFNKIAQYLIPNSDYYNRAYRWATGEDITFTSPHTLGDPIFRDLVVDDLIVYSERCFSIHIAFKKDMFLTVTGGTALDETNSRFVFLSIDDTDDGVDNPHWVLADMIAQ